MVKVYFLFGYIDFIFLFLKLFVRDLLVMNLVNGILVGVDYGGIWMLVLEFN